MNTWSRGIGGGYQPKVKVSPTKPIDRGAWVTRNGDSQEEEEMSTPKAGDMSQRMGVGRFGQEEELELSPKPTSLLIHPVANGFIVEELTGSSEKKEYVAKTLDGLLEVIKHLTVKE